MLQSLSLSIFSKQPPLFFFFFFLNKTYDMFAGPRIHFTPKENIYLAKSWKKMYKIPGGKAFFFHVVLLICVGTWRSDFSQLGPTQWFSEVKEEPQCVLLLSYFFSSSSVSESFFFYYDYFYFGFVLILQQIGKTENHFLIGCGYTKSDVYIHRISIQ